MMKINYKVFTALALTSLMFTSCDEGDAVVDSITANTLRGAVLRTIAVTSNELPIGVAEGNFAVDLEIQSEEDGTLVTSVDVYGSFRDNTPGNGPGNAAEVFLETLDASTFTTGSRGLPTFSYSVTLPELLAATGVAESEVDGGDEFRVRFELVLSDGRTYSFAQNSGTLTQTYFASPFLYTATIVCPPTAPAAGTWTFETLDAYGDSWNGASLDVSIDGADPIVIANTNADGISNNSAAGGESITYTVEVPAGTETISIQFTSGAFDGEIGYTVTSASGNVILSQEAYADTTPSAGVELINYCVKNF